MKNTAFKRFLTVFAIAALLFSAAAPPIAANAGGIQDVFNTVSGNDITTGQGAPANETQAVAQPAAAADSPTGNVRADIGRVVDKMIFRYVLQNPGSVLKYGVQNFGSVASDLWNGKKSEMILKYVVEHPDELVNFAIKNKDDIKKSLDWKENIAFDFAVQNPDVIKNYIKNNKAKVINDVKTGNVTGLAMDVALQNPLKALDFAANNSGSIINGLFGQLLGNNGGNNQNGQNMRAAANDAGNGIQAVIGEAKNAFSGIANGFKDFFGGLKNAFKDIGNTFKNAFKEIGNAFKNIFK